MLKLTILAVTAFSLGAAAPNCKGRAAMNFANRSGCCSHHGGVCGCSGGYNRCCDGAQSPTCTC